MTKAQDEYDIQELKRETRKLVKALGQALRQWRGHANMDRQYADDEHRIDTGEDDEAQLWQTARGLYNQHCELHERLP